MGFYIFLLCGFLGGILGGMGMGGGTVLIPLLTVFCGVGQAAAQAVNLLSSIPMSAIALSIHARSGLLNGRGLPYLIVPATLFSLLFALLAARLPQVVLKKAFGAFLIALSLRGFLGSTRAFRIKKDKTF